MFKSIAVATVFLTSLCCQAHVLVFTFAYNRPDFIEIQHKTLKKFLLDEEYEFIVFSDAKIPEMQKAIEEKCVTLGIRHISIPQEIHAQPYLPRLPGEDFQHPTVRNVNVVQYALNNAGFEHDGEVLLLDSDMFLVKPFSVHAFLNGYSLGGAMTGNGHVEFLWHALALLDMGSMPNKRSLTFNCGQVDGHPIDGGGHSYYYLRDNPDAKVRFMTHTHTSDLKCDSCKALEQPLCSHNSEVLKTVGFSDPQIEFIQNANEVEFFHDNSFLHYRGGSNWDNRDAKYHEMKTKALTTYMDAILKDEDSIYE